MSLRYKGKPELGSNIQADRLPELCFCKFVAVGFSMDARTCSVHQGQTFGCDQCGSERCSDYRPNSIKKFPRHWPRCCCGHIAQEHNQ